MALVSFSHLLLGMLFVIRTTQVFRARAVISQEVVTKTGTGLVAMMCSAQFFCAHSPWHAFFADVFLAFSPLVFFSLHERRQLTIMRARVPLFVDRWILNLRLGQSVSAAREAALREESEILKALLRPLFGARSTPRADHVLLPAFVCREFEIISSSAQSPLGRLENLRLELRRVSEFRHKSGQAVRQTAIQSSLMLILQFALMVFTVQRYGWTRSGDFLVISALLSVFGVALMMRFAKKRRWNL